MLEAIGFDNYRIFDKETIINLKPITILTGPNSSGKSSVIKAAKLLKQNAQKFSVGIPVELSFMPDEYGHFLGSINNITNKTAKRKSNDEITFAIRLDLPSLGEYCLGKITYLPHLEKENIGIFRRFEILVKVEDKLESIITLMAASKEVNIYDEYYKIHVNFSLITKIYQSTFIPLLKKIHSSIFETNEFDYSALKKILRNLPRYERKSLEPEIDIYKQDKYFKEEIKVDEWLKYDPQKPVMPYYKLFTGEMKADDITIENCKYYHLDYSKIIKSFNETQKKVSEKAFKELDLPVTSKNNKISSERIYKYFNEIEQDLFNFINQNKIWFSFEHSTGSVEKVMSSIQWNGISFSNFFKTKEVDVSLKKLAKYKMFKELIITAENYYFLSDKEILTNESIIHNFISSIIYEAERLINENIKSPYFFDSNRIEQTLFYHSSNSPFIYSLLNHFFLSDFYKVKENLKFIREEIRFMGIADDFEITQNEYGIYVIHLIKENERRLLSNHGYGITKVFFLLLAISIYDIVFVEEPETNLHPDLQSKLADVIMRAQKEKNKQLIIETHSEYFIRKLQYLVAKNEIDSDNILINYFNPASYREKEGIVREISIEKDGSLSNDFGPGFFDEALNWKFELMKLKNQN